MPTAFVLLNSDFGSDEIIISEIKNLLTGEKDIDFEIQGVYGVYDIVLKITSSNSDHLRSFVTEKIRKIDKVQSTLTMMVIQEQE